MIDARIADGSGAPRYANIDVEGEMSVVVHPHPPRNEKNTALPYRRRFADSSGSFDMAVNGSVSPVEYSVNAIEDFDIYLKYISLVIGDDGSPALNKFGALPALANGVLWSRLSQREGEIVLHDGIKTNLEMIRVGNDTAAVGDGVTAFLSDVSGGGTEKSYLPSIDLAELFGLPFGVRLRKGSTDRMSFTVRDDLSTLITFDAISYGLTS